MAGMKRHHDGTQAIHTYNKQQPPDGTGRQYGDTQAKHRRLSNHQCGQRYGGNVPTNGNVSYEMSRKPEVRKSKLDDKQRALMKARSGLPIHPHTPGIRRALHLGRDVLLLVGETGSGKSTQVPQYLLSEPWCKRGIAITQPRRVAAVSLARRVAEEMGTTLGTQSPKSLVGYSVRFDQNVAPATRLKYLTEGMLLQEMLRDPFMTQYSCVIVDEVHERSVNCDLILGFLRRLVTSKRARKERRGEPLKVVVMSATAEVEALYDFFAEGFREDTINGVETTTSGPTSPKPTPLTNGVKPSTSSSHKGKKKIATIPNGHEPLVKGSHHNDASSSSFSGFSSDSETDKPSVIEAFSDHISTHYVEGRQYPVEISYLSEPAQEYIEAALDTIFQIHRKEPLPGDILVFVTGQDVVESLEALIKEKAAELDPSIPRLHALPLFAALPHAAQQAIFNPTKKGTRKVILATNIAETSVTIPGVRFVVDSGLAKVKEFRSSLGLDSLLVKPISRSAAIQRKGRAGREAPGKCYRLYTEKEYLKLEEANTPEILRCDLATAILTMKARGVADPLTFPLLSRPPSDSLQRAFQHLLRLGALDEKGNITSAGKQMSRLPLAPALSRVIIAAAAQDAASSNIASDSSQPAESDPEASLTLATIDIIAALSSEKFFLPTTASITTNPDSDSTANPANQANTTDPTTDDPLPPRLHLQQTLHHRTGDHLTALLTLRSYASERTDRVAFSTARHLSHRALKAALTVRTQLRAQCIQSRLLHPSTVAGMQRLEDSGTAAPVGPEMAERVLRCFLVGFAGNVAVLRKSAGGGGGKGRGGGGSGGRGEYRTIEGVREVVVHPGSVLFGRRCEAVLFQELVFTGRAFARGCSAVQVDWYAEAVGVVGAG